LEVEAVAASTWAAEAVAVPLLLAPQQRPLEHTQSMSVAVATVAELTLVETVTDTNTEYQAKMAVTAQLLVLVQL
jgi:hypothetical protein